MIITEKILIKVNNKVNYYRDKGYICKRGDLVYIDIKDVSIGSHIKILVKCDICGLEKELQYKKYNENIQRGGYYSCSEKCCINKRKNTCNEKYGVDNYTKTDEYVIISKETNMRKYGVDSYTKTDEFKNRTEKIMIDRYGGYTLQVPILKEKVLKTNLKRYNVENPFQNEEIKNIIKKGNIQKYGVEYYSQTIEFGNKFRKTCIEKYGEEHYSKTSDFLSRTKQTKINNGSQIPDYLLSEFKIYKNNVKNLTNKLRKELFDNWNGYDYYDMEYIKDNLKLRPNGRLYPSVDHKISVYYGFKNNLPIENIANISNLCITKRFINSIKGKLNENEFKQY